MNWSTTPNIIGDNKFIFCTSKKFVIAILLNCNNELLPKHLSAFPMNSDTFFWLRDPAGDNLPATLAQLWHRISESSADAMIPRRSLFWRRLSVPDMVQSKPLRDRVGPLHRQLLDELEKVLVPSGSSQLDSANDAPLSRSDFPAALQAVERMTFKAQEEARDASRRLHDHGGQLFAETHYSGGDPSEWQEFDAPVDTVEALKACPCGPTYLYWAIDVAGALRGRHASALRNLLEQEAGLLLRPSVCERMFHAEFLEDYASEEVDENGEWHLVFDEADWRAAQQATECGPGRTVWEQAIHARAVESAVPTVRAAFEARPAPDLHWPWRGEEDPVSGYQPDSAAGRPGWPFACELRPQDRRQPARLRREGDARWQLGAVLDATGRNWLATQDPEARADWAIIKDAGHTLRTAGTVLRLLAEALEPAIKSRSRCAVCGQHIEGSVQRGRMYCRDHVTRSAAPGKKHQGERSEAYRLQGWGHRRSAVWHALSASLGEDRAINHTLSDLQAWWKDPERMRCETSRVDEQCIAELLARLQTWTGAGLHQRLQALLPIWCRLATEKPEKGWLHPITLFALHFAGAAHITKGTLSNDEEQRLSNVVTASRGVVDPLAPSDSNHPLAKLVRDVDNLHLDSLLAYIRTDILCDLLTQRSWMECGGASMDKARTAGGSMEVPAPPTLARRGQIDVEKARQMLGDGFTKKAIADAFGVTRSAVTQFFDRQKPVLPPTEN